MRRAAALAAALAALGGVGAAPSPAAQQRISSAGPVSEILVSDGLQCQVTRVGNQGGEFRPGTAAAGACGTFLATGGKLYGPAVPGGPNSDPFLPVSQDRITGTGVPADPFVIRTVVSVPTTLLQVVETDSYVVGEDSYTTSIAVVNDGQTAAGFTLYHAGDCLLGHAAQGFGALAAGRVSCARTPNDKPSAPRLDFTDAGQTLDGSLFEGAAADVWNQVLGGGALTGTCACAKFTDNGLAIGWPVAQLAAGGTATRAVRTTLPVGGPLAATGAVQGVRNTQATVGGRMNAGGQLTKYHFDYGTTTTYGQQSAEKTFAGGTDDVPVAGTLTGLRPGTAYHYRLVATNPTGTAQGADVTLTTPAPPPRILAGSHQLVDPSQVNIVATIRTFGAPATCRVIYETQAQWTVHHAFDANGRATKPQACSTPVGGPADVTIPLTGLSPGTDYHFRFDLRSAGGFRSAFGPRLVFSTPPLPAVFQNAVPPPALVRDQAADAAPGTQSALQAIGAAPVARGLKVTAGIAVGSRLLAQVSKEGRVLAAARSAIVGASSGGLLPAGGATTAGARIAGEGLVTGDGKAVPVSSRGVVVVGPQNAIHEPDGDVVKVPSGQVGYVDSGGNVVALGAGQVPGSAKEGSVSTVGSGKTVATGSHRLRPRGPGSITALSRGTPSSLSVVLSNDDAGGRSTVDVTVSRRTFAKYAGGSEKGGAVSVMRGALGWKEPGTETLKLKPTRRGRAFLRGLAQAVQRAQRGKRKVSAVKLTVKTVFDPKKKGAHKITATRRVSTHPGRK